MFTGIVEELGSVESRDGPRLRIAGHEVLDDVSMGDSIAVNGCCLTVVAWGDDWWEADVSDETFARTSLRGSPPVTRSTSNVPCASRTASAATWSRATSTASARSSPRCRTCGCRHRRSSCATSSRRAPSPSTACRLTVVDVLDDGFTVAVIPHTAAVTTLGVAASATGSTSRST